MSAPCGIVSINTTCSNVTARCPIPTQCTISPVTADCAISIVLGDGTNHAIEITTGNSQFSACGSMNVVIASTLLNFSSPSCQQSLPEASADVDVDAPGDASDASDAPMDGSPD